MLYFGKFLGKSFFKRHSEQHYHLLDGLQTQLIWFYSLKFWALFLVGSLFYFALPLECQLNQWAINKQPVHHVCDQLTTSRPVAMLSDKKTCQCRKASNILTDYTYNTFVWKFRKELQHNCTVQILFSRSKNVVNNQMFDVKLEETTGSLCEHSQLI